MRNFENGQHLHNDESPVIQERFINEFTPTPSYPLAVRTTFVGAHLSVGNWVQELDAGCMQWFDQKLIQIKEAMLAYSQFQGKTFEFSSHENWSGWILFVPQARIKMPQKGYSQDKRSLSGPV